MSTGGGTTTTKVKTQPMSEEERALLQKTILLTDETLQSFKQQQAFQTGLFENLGDELAAASEDINKRQDIEDLQFEQAINALGLSEDALMREADLAAAGPELTPEQEALIDETFTNQLALGESEIDRQAQDALMMIREELAPSRGLRPTDTPITDRGMLVGRETARAKGDLLRNLTAQAAATKLNFPLTAGDFQSRRNQFLVNAGLSSADFQDALQQQAFENRLKLIGQTGNLGLGLATFTGANPGGTAVALQRNRFAASPTTVSESGSFDPWSAAGAVGGLLSGIGAVCWLAREVYGESNPRWHAFRHWMIWHSPPMVLAVYCRYARRAAEFVSRKPILKAMIRTVMDGVLKYAA